MRERLDQINDPELRRELAKGSILIDYQNGDTNDPTIDILLLLTIGYYKLALLIMSS